MKVLLYQSNKIVVVKVLTPHYSHRHESKHQRGGGEEKTKLAQIKEEMRNFPIWLFIKCEEKMKEIKIKYEEIS